MEAADLGALGDVARVAADVLVAARAERVRALAGEDDHADVAVLAGALQRLGDLDERLRPEGVAHLGAVDRDLRDPVAAELVADVGVVAVAGGPGHCHGRQATFRAMVVESWLARAARTRPDTAAVNGLTYAALHARARAAAAGLPRGARVGIALPPGEEYVVALHACLLAGALVVPIDLRLTEAERPAVDLVFGERLHGMREVTPPTTSTRPPSSSTPAAPPASPSRSASPTATGSGARWAARSRSASTPTSAGSARCR